MEFDASEVQKLGVLARLQLDDATAVRMAGELSRILAYVEQLADVEASSGEPEGTVARRADLPVLSDAEPILAASAGRKGRLVEIPPVKEES